MFGKNDKISRLLSLFLDTGDLTNILTYRAVIFFEEKIRTIVEKDVIFKAKEMALAKKALNPAH